MKSEEQVQKMEPKTDENTFFMLTFKKAQEIGVSFRKSMDARGEVYKYEVKRALATLKPPGTSIKFGPAIDARRFDLQFISDWPFDLELAIGVPWFRRTHYIHLFADWEYGHEGDPGTSVDIDIVLDYVKVIRLYTGLQLARNQMNILAIQW